MAGGPSRWVPPALARERGLGDLRRRVAEDLGRIQVAPGEDGVAGFVTVHDDEVEQLYVAPEARGRMWPAGCWTTPSRSSPNATIGRGPWWPPTGRRGLYARQGWADAGPLAYAARTGRHRDRGGPPVREKQVRP